MMSYIELLVILVGLTLVSLVVSVLLYRRDPEFGKVLSAVQAMITIVGLVLAGLWYFVERKGLPHADVRITAQAARLSPKAADLLVRVTVANKGAGVLRIDRRVMRVMALKLRDATVDTALALRPGDFPAALPDGHSLYDAGEIAWAGLREYADDRIVEIEPGETDSIFVDFILPCAQPLVKLSATVRKPGREDLWWKDRRLVDLGTVCDTAPDKPQFGEFGAPGG